MRLGQADNGHRAAGAELVLDVGQCGQPAAMRARGIDISAEYPKPWTDEVFRAADVAVTSGLR